MAGNANYPVSASSKVANLWNSDHVAADEGNFFVATNPTSGTVIATTTSVVDDAATASATHAQNVPVLLMQNAWSEGDPNAKNIYPRYLRMMLTQVPTSATSWQMSVRADKNPSAYTSGGSTITPVNVNTGSSVGSKAAIYFGAVVTPLPLAATARLLARAQVNAVIPVTLDQWLFTFGTVGMGGDQLANGAGAKNVLIPLPPIIIAPGWNIRVGMWGTSNAAAPSWEFELGYVERAGGQ